jgi:hypothetical protein
VDAIAQIRKPTIGFWVRLLADLFLVYIDIARNNKCMGPQSKRCLYLVIQMF